ncbi:IQ domain-containing protein K isoform X1 [Caretta caretta]|uniref:IQ domain-containing protein K isoform X1 n=1 Tax=Caretta caretta TaxID=8467 RepID=UPI003F4B0688
MAVAQGPKTLWEQICADYEAEQPPFPYSPESKQDSVSLDTGILQPLHTKQLYSAFTECSGAQKIPSLPTHAPLPAAPNPKTSWQAAGDHAELISRVTMMESQNRKRAPAWTEREVRDLIAVWGEESVLSELRSSFRNAKSFVKISQGIKDRGHNRDTKQCRVKLKELRQAYQKTREANGRSGSEPQTCRFYDELHAILGGSATSTPAVLFDSFNGDGGNTEAGFGDEKDDDEVVDSSQQASGETGFPDSQELFLTLDPEPVPPEPTQGCFLDPAGGEGTSAACVSMITGSSPSRG